MTEEAAGWPDADELKRALNVDSDAWDETVQANLDAAVDKVKADVGGWDEDVDSPTRRLNRAAFRMAILMSQAPGVEPGDLDNDPVYRANLTGHRRGFGVA